MTFEEAVLIVAVVLACVVPPVLAAIGFYRSRGAAS